MLFKIVSVSVHKTNSFKNLTPIKRLVLIANVLQIQGPNCQEKSSEVIVQICDKFRGKHAKKIRINTICNVIYAYYILYTV